VVAFGATPQDEFDGLPLAEGFEAVADNLAVMHEDVTVDIFVVNESVTFGVVEPFD
jgi:hypothetical protein